MSGEEIRLTIDDIELSAHKGELLIEVADRAGIRIPRFCYHKKLSIAANCRMCLVEVEKAPKPLPACATPVMDGMKVYTTSPKALAAQQGTMEFLLINHPLDCPICDQGGECELQDVALGYGNDVSRYVEAKRVVVNEDIGPLVATEMTRCIHCTRCVRFGEEIAGLRELGATGRSEFMRIGTFVAHTLQHEMAANVIDLCPVGALTAKPSKDRYRPWELRTHAGIALHDCVGSHLNWHVRGAEVARVVPRAEESINEVWLSDRDRFSYAGLQEQRLTVPMVRRQGEWVETDWDTALEQVLEGFPGDEPEQCGALLSAQASIEELYLAQKLLRGLGVMHLDHRLLQTDFSHPEQLAQTPTLGVSIAELSHQQAVLMLGGTPRKSQPILHHRLRQAGLNGAWMAVLEPFDSEPIWPLAGHQVAAPAQLLAHLLRLTTAALSEAGMHPPVALKSVLARIIPEDEDRAWVNRLREAEHGLVLLDSGVSYLPQASLWRALASTIAQACECAWGEIPAHANSVGAWLAGALPQRGPGGQILTATARDAASLLQQGCKRYFLQGVEPDLDTAWPVQIRQRLREARFTVALTAYHNQVLLDHADVLLPMATLAESAGTLVNAQARWQSFNGVLAPPGEARPGWKILRVLGSLAGLRNFDYQTITQVRDELHALCEPLATQRPYLPLDSGEYALPELPGRTLERVSFRPLYAVDGMVRRAAPLQATLDGETHQSAVFVHPSDALRLGLTESLTSVEVIQETTSLRLPLVLDTKTAPGTVRLALGVKATVGLSQAFGSVELRR